MRGWDEYLALAGGYGLALGGWWLIRGWAPGLWPPRTLPAFPRPWTEVAWLLPAIAGVVWVGQLWSRGLLLPEVGPWGHVPATLNQLLIFLPVLLVPRLRGQGAETMWIPPDRPAARVGVGVVLAVAALAAWSFVRPDDHGFLRSLAALPSGENLDEAVQVLCEDMAVALLFVRLSAAMGPHVAMGLAGSVFAGAHIPALLSGGSPARELMFLAGDAGLAVLVLATLRRSGDILWFWPVHLVLDLTQFPRITG